jgi:outer membrane receptor for ferrienterochelin and colicin
VGVAQITVPGKVELSQNYPNPFSLSTSIHYQLAENCEVKLGVYNLLGMQVRGLLDQQQNAGSYQVDFDAEDLAPGVYIYRLEVGTKVYQRRMVLMD